MYGQATILLKRPAAGRRTSILSARDLVSQSEIAYGTLNTGFLVKALKTANETLYRTMWTKMSHSTPSVFTKTNQEGVDRTRRGKYAFILPSTIGDYVARKSPCDLVTVDRFLFNVGYAFVLPKHSGFLSKINDVLTTLDKQGVLKDIYNKWWRQRSDCVSETDAQQQRSYVILVNSNMPTNTGRMLYGILIALLILRIIKCLIIFA